MLRAVIFVSFVNLSRLILYNTTVQRPRALQNPLETPESTDTSTHQIKYISRLLNENANPLLFACTPNTVKRRGRRQSHTFGIK